MKIFSRIIKPLLTAGFLLLAAVPVFATDVPPPNPTVQMSLPFVIPDLSQILTFAIRLFFSIAALVALVYLILGAFAWITSGGEKEAVKKAQDKITNALLGLILIVVVLAIAVTLEQVVFNKQVCFGITCPVQIPGLLKPKNPNVPQTGQTGTDTGVVGGVQDQFVITDPNSLNSPDPGGKGL